jgi:ADP-ribosylarginine hydrolase
MHLDITVDPGNLSLAVLKFTACVSRKQVLGCSMPSFSQSKRPELCAGGAGALSMKLSSHAWPVSDDTVLHLAIAEGLVEAGCSARDQLYGTCRLLAKHMKVGMGDMAGRAPGNGTINAMQTVASDGAGWDKNPASKRGGGGCGAAMRSMVIGLRFHKPQHLPWLVAYAVESSKVTHNNALGWMGGLVAAYFMALAVRRGVSVPLWCNHMQSELLPCVRQHLVSAARDIDQMEAMEAEFSAWQTYAYNMGLPTTEDQLQASDGQPWQRGAEWSLSTPEAAAARDDHFKRIVPGKWPGSTGRGACLIAYDALLAVGGSYEGLVHVAMMHGGDNDSTGAIAGAWWGGLYGFKGVPDAHQCDLEYRQRLLVSADALWRASRDDE